MSIAGRLFINCQEFSQVDGNSQVEAFVAQGSEFVLYSWISGQPEERSKMSRDMVSLGNS